MANLTTQEVMVSAESTYQDRYSNPGHEQYVFSYRIQIKNCGNQPLQLIARKWEVIDATGNRRYVDGEGVVGQQPVILPGQAYEYNSWVQFETRLGAMQGSYVMARTDSRGRRQYFKVRVPKFLHTSPSTLN